MYGNYQRELDCYIKFSSDATAVHHYQLEMPEWIIADDAIHAGDFYPQPNTFYQATGKVWKARYTDEDWAAYHSNGGSSMAADAEEDGTMAADADENTTMTTAPVNDSPAM